MTDNFDPFQDQPDCLTPTLIAVICICIGILTLAAALVVL